MSQHSPQPPVKHAEEMRRKAVERKHLLAAKSGRIDVPFLLLTLLLTVIGLVMLFSASFPSAYYEKGDPAYYFKRQAIFAAIGMVGLVFAAKFNYQRWRGAARLLLIFSVFLLMLVLIPGIGISHNNARRWLGIDQVFTFQPSEIAKLAVIVYFADSISKKREKMLQWREGIVPYAVILGVLSILMLLEPHLSGTILIVGTGAIMMAVGGMQGWLIGAGVGALTGAGVGAYMDRQEAKLRAQLQGTGVSVTRNGNDLILNMPGNITFKTASAKSGRREERRKARPARGERRRDGACGDRSDTRGVRLSRRLAARRLHDVRHARAMSDVHRRNNPLAHPHARIRRAGRAHRLVRQRDRPFFRTLRPCPRRIRRRPRRRERRPDACFLQGKKMTIRVPACGRDIFSARQKIKLILTCRCAIFNRQFTSSHKNVV